MAQIGLADNYIRRMSITSSLAAAGVGGGGAEVWPVEGEERVVYPNTRVGRLNKRFARSRLGRFFDIEYRRTTLMAEMRAGLVGFLTVRVFWGWRCERGASFVRSFSGRAHLPHLWRQKTNRFATSLPSTLPSSATRAAPAAPQIARARTGAPRRANSMATRATSSASFRSSARSSPRPASARPSGAS